MLTVWILHRDVRHRAALARIAGVGDNTVLGAPSDRLFESASVPAVVVLGLSGDFEHELEFVHRMSPRLSSCAWILLAPAEDMAEARRLFDTLPAVHLPYPPRPMQLRRALRAALQRRHADSLSSRRVRDELRDRFARWFATLELPELLRAIDPRLCGVPLLVRGEEGTGRSLLARYVHTFSGSGEETFVHVSCDEIDRADDLLAQIRESGAVGREDCWTIWLQDVDRLSMPLQRRVQDWIEFGLPDGTLRVSKLRWIVGASDETELYVTPGLDPRLAQAISGLSVRIPPLRERPECVAPFVADTTLYWCNAYGERLRRFSDDSLQLLREHPWPGNLHELESVVIRTLSFTSADPILPVHLRFPGDGACLPLPGSMPAAAVQEEAEIPEATLVEDDLSEEVAQALAPLSDFEEGEPRSRGLAVDLAVDLAESAAEGVLPGLRQDEPRAVATPAEPSLRRLVRAVAHEVRNPLVSIRTFSELLPDHYEDADFRTHFRELVGKDVRRIEDVVTRLQSMGDLGEAKPQPVDVAELLENLLDARRSQIQARRLLVLKELDRGLPYALGDPAQLRDAFASVIDHVLGQASERGDLYLASKHHSPKQPPKQPPKQLSRTQGGPELPAGGLRGGPSLRVLLRHTNPSATWPPAVSPSSGIAGLSREENDLDLLVAEAVIRAQGGSLTLDSTDAHESVIVIDLPAPAE